MIDIYICTEYNDDIWGEGHGEDGSSTLRRASGRQSLFTYGYVCKNRAASALAGTKAGRK